jgi:hypothetical protein
MSCKKHQAPNEGEVLRVKEIYEKRLLALSNVVGVGIGYKTIRQTSTNKLCIKVYVEHKVPLAGLAKAQVIPGKLDGVETDVEQAGKIEAKL